MRFAWGHWMPRRCASQRCAETEEPGVRNKDTGGREKRMEQKPRDRKTISGNTMPALSSELPRFPSFVDPAHVWPSTALSLQSTPLGPFCAIKRVKALFPWAFGASGRIQIMAQGYQCHMGKLCPVGTGAQRKSGCAGGMCMWVCLK